MFLDKGILEGLGTLAAAFEDSVSTPEGVLAVTAHCAQATEAVHLPEAESGRALKGHRGPNEWGSL